jgi:prepilin-type N-terminal cleavage/methylation domain-containing protein
MRRGFTLIELSIVLVIIGLIIGGVLVGQDLIKAAELRGTISQFQKFDAAATAFRLKYGHLPGDIPPAVAGSFGLFQLTDTCSGTCTAYRLGNGKIDTSTGTASLDEYLTVWRHLSEANLIEGRLGMDSTNPINPLTGNITSNTTGWYRLFMPETKLKGTYLFMMRGFRFSPSTYDVIEMPNADYSFHHPSFPLAGVPNSFGVNPSLSPILSYAIDSKIDDGKPNTGTVVELSVSSTILWNTTPTNGVCTYGGADELSSAANYNTNASLGGNDLLCGIRVKSVF